MGSRPCVVRVALKHGEVAVPIDGIPGDTMAPAAGPYYIARSTNVQRGGFGRDVPLFNRTGPVSRLGPDARPGPDLLDEIASLDADGESDDHADGAVRGFLERLAKPYLFAVPIGTPTIPGGAAAGKVLVQLPPGQTFENAVDELDGDVAKLFVGSYALEPIDPALIWSELGRQVAHATCAGLLRHTERDGLVPEAATGMPTVSDDGRTYTFTIRSRLPLLPAGRRRSSCTGLGRRSGSGVGLAVPVPSVERLEPGSCERHRLHPAVDMVEAR